MSAKNTKKNQSTKDEPKVEKSNSDTSITKKVDVLEKKKEDILKDRNLDIKRKEHLIGKIDNQLRDITS